MNRFHTEIFKGHHPGFTDSFGYEVSCPTNSHQIHRSMRFNRINGDLSSFSLTNHADQPGVFEQRAGKFVHPCRCCRTGRTNHFLAYRINRADVVNKLVIKIHPFRQRLPVF